MSNPLSTIGHGIEVAAKDIVKAVDFLPHVVSLLDTAITNEPQVKSLIANLITQAGTVISTGSTAVAGKGANLLADAATLAAAESFFTYFKDTFLPAAESLYKDLAADVK